MFGLGKLDKVSKPAQLTEEQLDEIKEAFTLFDTNHTGRGGLGKDVVDRDWGFEQKKRGVLVLTLFGFAAMYHQELSTCVNYVLR